jgi:hypothetical protein
VSNIYENFYTPVGRILSGDVAKAFLSKEDELKGKSPQFFVGLAIPKTDPQVDALIAKIKATAAIGWAAQPSMLRRKDFAWKIKDGDSEDTNKKGERLCDKEGYPGHWVFSLESLQQPRLVNEDHTERFGQNFKRGDFVRVAGFCKGTNGSEGNPGLYLTHTHVMFIREGDPIGSSNRTSRDAFGESDPTPPTPPTPPTAVELTEAGVATGCTWAELEAAGWTVETARAAGMVK